MPISTRTKHRIWYDSAGAGESHVLLVMGFTMRGRAWRAQIEEFPQHHQVAWFDHAGLGRSGPVEEPLLYMHHMADDAVGVMDDLGWPSAHIVGISMGGMIAQHIALRAPDRVDSLTLAVTHAGGLKHTLPPREGIELFLEANRGGSRDARLEALSRLLFSDSFRREQPDRARELLERDFAHPPPRPTRLAQLHAISRHRTRPQLYKLGRHPTLVVRAGQDVLIRPEGSDLLASGIPGAHLVNFEDAGHAVSRQCSAQFNDVVLQHIAQTHRRDS